MRTLQIGDDWLEEKEGGLARYFYELLRHLPATGTDPKGLVIGSARVAKSTGGRVVAFARADQSLLKRVYAARRAALAEIKLEKVDLIASHFALYAAPIADRLCSIPSVVHFHGPWCAESGIEGSTGLNARFKKFVEMTVYTKAKRLIVLSRSFQQELTNRYGISEDLIRIVPGGIDVDRFHVNVSRSAARETLGWPIDRPIVLAVRRHVHRMGLENLIDAAKSLVQNHPDLLILIGGSGPITNDLRRRVADLGLESHVRLVGRIDDVQLPLAYRAANMSIVPSQALEGFGLITLESLASGTPVLVTPVGGLPEIVLPFAPQCIFKDTSTAEMESVLNEVLQGTRALPTPEACRSYAVAKYSWPQIARQVRAVYDEAVR